MPLLFLAWLLVGLPSVGLTAEQIRLKADQGQSAAQVASEHNIELQAFLDLNHLASARTPLPQGQFFNLPPNALPIRELSTGIVASGGAELEPVLTRLKLIYTYEITGRKFFVGTLRNQTIVAMVTGGGLINSSIATTILLMRFHIDHVMFVGIAGSGEKLTVGDICIPSLIFQHDLGTWFDQEGNSEGHGSLLWQSQGIAILSNIKKAGRVVGLKPDLEWVKRLTEKMGEAPDVGKNPVAHAAYQTGRITSECVSASGSQFVMSRAEMTRLRQNTQHVRSLNSNTRTEEGLIVDQEDIAFAVAAEEAATPWVIVRIVADHAQPIKIDRRLPPKINTSEAGWEWLQVERSVPDADWGALYARLGALVMQALD